MEVFGQGKEQPRAVCIGLCRLFQFKHPRTITMGYPYVHHASNSMHMAEGWKALHTPTGGHRRVLVVLYHC
jgi:hypothetical protein